MKDKKLTLLILSIFSVWVVANTLFITWYHAQNINSLHDDAYYYLLTAVNYVKYGFYTLDSINATNGFHPLMIWLETIIVYIVGEDIDRFTLYRIILGFIGSSIALFSVFQAWYLYKKQSQYLYSFIITLSILTSILSFHFINGLESVLVLIFGSALIILLLRKKFFLASIIGAFLVMSRLDAFIYFLPPLYLAACFSIFKKHQYLEFLKRLALLFLPAIIFTILYMLYNYSVFGHFTPISAKIKSTFPIPTSPQFGFLASKEAIATLLITAFTFVILLLNKNIRLHQKSIVLGLIGVTLMYLINFSIFQNWLDYLPPWYWSMSFLTTMTALILSTVNLFGLSKNRIMTAIMLSFIIIGCTFYRTYQHKKGMFNALATIQVAPSVSFLKNLPDSSIIAYTDNGFISYYCEKRIINLDGVMNNFEYQSVLKNKQLKQYFKSNNVDYLVVNFHKKNDLLKSSHSGKNKIHVINGDYSSTPYFLYSFMYKQFSDTLNLYKYAEVHRDINEEIGSGVIIYDLHKNAICQNN